MKIYLHDKRVVCAGKAWEIRQILKQYSKKYRYVKEWLEEEKVQKRKMAKIEEFK
ncbi:MAG: Z-ring formation inhibitor MciZ [Bacillus sp. (in: firmicutes)]